MKAITAKVTRGLNIGSKVVAADNSGARIVRITGVKHGKTKKGRQQPAKVGDWVKVSVRAGKPEETLQKTYRRKSLLPGQCRCSIKR